MIGDKKSDMQAARKSKICFEYPKKFFITVKNWTKF